MVKRAKIIGRRPYLNQAEEAFASDAEGRGWNITKKGWPDFLCTREANGKTEIMCVEVKPGASERTIDGNLPWKQQRVMDILASHGIPCYIWTPHTGLVKSRKRQA